MTRFLICSTLLHFPPQSLIASVSHLGAENLTEAAQFPPATAPIYIAVNYVCSDMISNKGEKIKQELAALYIDSGCLPSSPSNIVGDKKKLLERTHCTIHSFVCKGRMQLSCRGHTGCSSNSLPVIGQKMLLRLYSGLMLAS